MTGARVLLPAAAPASGRIGALLQRHGIFVGLAALVILNTLITPNFWAWPTLRLQLRQVTPLVFASLGMAFVVATKGIDISVGAVMAVASVVIAQAIGPLGWPAAVLLALTAAAVCGLLNGTLVAFLGVQPIVATLGFLVGGRGLASVMVDGQSRSLYNDTFILFGRKYYELPLGASVPFAALVWAALDLSVGSVAALAGVLVAKFVEAGINPVVALLATVAIGALIGLAQGMAIARGNLEPFIVTLAGLLSVRGLALLVSDERNVALPNEGLARTIATGTVFSVRGYEVSSPAAIMLATFLIGAVVLRRTTFGRSLFAIGGDEKSARLLGVKVVSVKARAYTVCAGLAALAGVLLAYRQTLGRPFAAEAYELFAIGAVVVGGTLLTGGRGSMLGSLFGTLLLFVIQVSINRMGLNAFWQQLVSGMFLLMAVAAQSLLQRVSEHSAAHRSPTGD